MRAAASRSGAPGRLPVVTLLGGHLRDEGGAGLLTAPAGFRADPAVVHTMLSMHLTLIAAEPAGRHTGLQGRLHQLRLGCRLTREDRAGSAAQIGTVEVQADAAGEASAHDVQACAQSTQAWMQSARACWFVVDRGLL